MYLPSCAVMLGQCEQVDATLDHLDLHFKAGEGTLMLGYHGPNYLYSLIVSMAIKFSGQVLNLLSLWHADLVSKDCRHYNIPCCYTLM